MGNWHMDPEVDRAVTMLLDRLCMWERATDRRSTLVLIPEFPDEPILMAEDGKPLPPDFDISPQEIVANAMAIRERHPKPS